jgi:hypothetical protein
MTPRSSIQRRWFEARQIQALTLAEVAAKLEIKVETLAAVETTGDLSALSDREIEMAGALYDVSIGFLRGH